MLIQKGCGSGSRSAWIRINLSCWIRIRMLNEDLDPGGQRLPTNREKGCSFMRADIKKFPIFFSCKFFQFLVNKTLDSELNPDPH
jgi:hypothetical protein